MLSRFQVSRQAAGRPKGGQSGAVRAHRDVVQAPGAEAEHPEGDFRGEPASAAATAVALHRRCGHSDLGGCTAADSTIWQAGRALGGDGGGLCRAR